VVDDVTVEIERQFDREAPSTAIGEAVMKRLRDLDEVAYVRFASVYRQFRDADEFVEEIQSMKKE
jgi:transcriptional repressor NrdR